MLSHDSAAASSSMSEDQVLVVSDTYLQHRDVYFVTVLFEMVIFAVDSRDPALQ